LTRSESKTYIFALLVIELIGVPYKCECCFETVEVYIGYLKALINELSEKYITFKILTKKNLHF